MFRSHHAGVHAIWLAAATAASAGHVTPTATSDSGRASGLNSMNSSATSPVTEWVSAPVRPGELLLVNGGGLAAVATAQMTWVDPKTGANVTKIGKIVGTPSQGTLTVEVPADAPFGPFALRLTDSTGFSSRPFAVNHPEIWWVIGDHGNTSTPGGWLRVFGKNFLLEQDPTAAATAARAAKAAAAAGDYLAAHAISAERQAQASPEQLGVVTLRLSPINSVNAATAAPILVTAPSSDVTTEFSAFFPLPSGLPEGEYTAEVQGNLPGSNFVPVTFIQSPMPSFPDVVPRNTVVVKAQAPWPSNVFPVAAQALLPPASGFADDAVAAAFDSAEKNGGGVVLFQPGRFYLSKPLLVPDKVVVRGHGQALTALYFASVGNRSEDAPTAYLIAKGAELTPNEVGYTSWRLESLSIYVSGAHNDVISVTNTTTGFEMRNVTVRANALFASPHSVGVGGHGAMPWQPSPMTAADGRYIGPVIRVHGTNFVIEGCDLYGTTDVIETQNNFNGSHPSYTGDVGTAWTQVHGAWWGRIANNKLYNGAGCSHRMNNWNQILFENNTAIGVGPVAMGQALGTGPVGSVSAHIFHARNTVQFVWGNDREVMTLDDAGGCYLGPVTVTNGTTLTLQWDPIPGGHETGTGFAPLPNGPFATNGWAGAEVVVINGTGAGQTRRVTLPGLRWNYTPSNRTWVIDRPFTVPLAADSWVEIQPYRGRIHFLDNTYVDTGAVQLYGHVSEVIMAGNTGERMVGFMMWGQWRGFFHPEANRSLLGGSFGVGANPNIKVLMLNNRHTDQGITNFEGQEVDSPGDGQSSWWTPDKIHNCPFTVRDSPYGNRGGLRPGLPYPNLPDAKPTISMNSLAVLRGNSIDAAGSIWIGWYASGVIVESNLLDGGDDGVIVSNTTLDGITVRGNVARAPAN